MQATFELFAEAGFALIPEVLTGEACEVISNYIQTSSTSGGTRSLLTEAWCVQLAQQLRKHPALSPLLPATHVAVQCSYFEKSAARNWLVPIHQDLSIPVARHVEAPSLRGWSEKEGTLFVQAPVEILQQLVAVRVHLDACTARDGPLRVVSGSHLQGIIAPDAAVVARASMPEVLCEASLGGALVMRPLLLHASSKAMGGSRRRVLHVLFGPPTLPHRLQWQHAV